MKKIKRVLNCSLAILTISSLLLQPYGFVLADATDTVTVDFNNFLRPVNPSTFGYILTPK